MMSNPYLLKKRFTNMLEVSRKDILSDELMKFDDRRFIKLPIDGYMDLLGIEPNTTQKAIINSIIYPVFFIAADIPAIEVINESFKYFLSFIFLLFLSLLITIG